MIVVEADAELKMLGGATLAQIYVDLLNIATWYARDFINEPDRMILDGVLPPERNRGEMEVLLELKGKHSSILIGGWAVWLCTKALKSSQRMSTR
ncbi:MAG: hypothetical protein Metus_1442 [Candidatus Methanosuratincola subterraneus]|uniref:Uncharacterized protein n=1 Tax=Methanosuratincola subterraneus TaxID=2593994 RepID=A0A3S3SRX8_METS7|nr:MAG: hypothetical protein Metus_1442 [Candidatus Methanosuratincola subterraneus]